MSIYGGKGLAMMLSLSLSHTHTHTHTHTLRVSTFQITVYSENKTAQA